MGRLRVSHAGHKHKRWLLLQKLSAEPSDFEASPPTWDTVYTVRGSVDTPRAGEVIEGQKVDSRISHKIEIRHMPNITNQWRVVIEDQKGGPKRILNIDSVIDYKDQHRYLSLMCIEAQS